MAVTETKPLTNRNRYSSCPDYNEQILNQLRALRANYGAMENFQDSTFRIFVENCVDTYLGRREEVKVGPDERIGSIVHKYLEMMNVTSDCDIIVKDGTGRILDKESTVYEANIKEDDVIFLDQGEPGVLSPWAGCWKPALLVLIFGFCLAGCALAIYMTSPERPYVYTILVDAGSVHTSVFVYRYSEKHEGTGLIEQVLSCQIGQVGISSFARQPDKLENYLNSTCFRSAAEMVYNEHDIAAPIVVAGTAGMRTLRITAPQETQWILGNLTFALNHLAKQRRVSVNIISGESEGLAGWVTANYLAGALNPQSQDSDGVRRLTYGALDWGGASSQITVEVPMSDANFDVTLYGSRYHVFTTSHLCFGQKMSVFRHRAQLLYEQYLQHKSAIKRTISEPCAPEGSSVAQSFKGLFGTACTQFLDKGFMNKVRSTKGSVRFVGTGNVTQCREHAAKAFDFQHCTSRFEQYTTDTVCFDPRLIESPPPRPFYAFSTYWYLIDALQLPRKHPMSRLEFEIEKMCTTHRNKLLRAGIDEYVVDSACYKALYMVEMLTKGYHFNSSTYEQIQFVRDLNGAEVGWTLGHTIISSNTMPAIAPTAYISDLMFGVCMVGVFSLAILSICVICTFQGRHSYKYHKLRSPFKPRKETTSRETRRQEDRKPVSQGQS